MDSLTRTLPASWFRSPALYQLERRAVFLKCWHLLGPVTLFQSRGPLNRVHFEIAQVQFYVENTSAPSDSPAITKDGIEVFALSSPDADITPLTSHITPTGLLFTTLSSSALPFHEFYPDLEALLERVDFTALPYRKSISYTGKFNWKTMIDGYQECLHCAYTHKSFSKLYPPTFYSVTNHGSWSRHIADPTKKDDGLFLYFFPVCTLNVYGGGMSVFRTCPTSEPGVSRMEFSYFHSGTAAEFEEYFAFVRRVAMEDFELCEKAQENLEKGVYFEGILNPNKEQGVSFYQSRTRDMVHQQRAAELEAAKRLMEVTLTPDMVKVPRVDGGDVEKGSMGGNLATVVAVEG